MPLPPRIHISGASGSGTSTLGRAIADRFGHAFLDADDFYWLPTTPPYRQKRPPPERLSLILAAITAHPTFVLSGSICGWGQDIEHAFDLVIFLTVPTDVRLQRLIARETARWGKADPEFLAWAAQYDTGDLTMRSRARHEQWLAASQNPILRLNGEQPLEASLAAISAPSATASPRQPQAQPPIHKL